MPRLSGWEVAQKILAFDPMAAIIFITGWGVQVSRKKLEQNGIKGILDKPVSRNEIVEIIARVLTEKRSDQLDVNL